METLANLESFARSAEAGSFSAAARALGLTPAGVSRNVALLEQHLGVRLFHRSTRRLALTEAGERFLGGIRQNLDGLQAAIADVATDSDEPAGVLKISMSPTFGIGHILPLLPPFLARYPRIRPDLHFENRHVDLVAEGYDAAIGSGFELSPGLVARSLAPAHMIAVAAPGYLAGRELPLDPGGLAQLDGIVMRSAFTGRVRTWMMTDGGNGEKPAELSERLFVNDPIAMTRAAVLGFGVTVVAVADALPFLETGELVRLVPQWHADAGPVSIYFSSKKLLPAKTRMFVDFIAAAFRERRLAARFSAETPTARAEP